MLTRVLSLLVLICLALGPPRGLAIRSASGATNEEEDQHSSDGESAKETGKESEGVSGSLELCAYLRRVPSVTLPALGTIAVLAPPSRIFVPLPTHPPHPPPPLERSSRLQV